MLRLERDPRARLACGWLTLFVVGTDLFVISPLLPRVAAEFGGGAGRAGLSVTVFSLAYLFSAPVLGYLADRFGRRTALLGCLLGFAAANLLTAIACGFVWLLVARIAAGAAASGISPLIYAGVGEAAPPARRATWMAIAVSGLLLALSVGAPAGTMLASYLGWRGPFLLIALCGLVLLGVNRVVWPLDTRRALVVGAAPALGSRSMVTRLLPTVLWATSLYAVYTYLGAWLAAAGRSPFQVANSITCYGIGALAGTLLGGYLADHFGTRRTMLASLTGLAACLSVFSSHIGAGWIADVMLLLTSIFAQLFFPAQQAELARCFASRRAFVLALNNSALFLGISIGSVIGGAAMARSGFAADAALGSVIALAGLIPLVVRGRPHPTCRRSRPGSAGCRPGAASDCTPPP